MPVQDDTANINAVIKPFQWPVFKAITFHKKLQGWAETISQITDMVRTCPCNCLRHLCSKSFTTVLRISMSNDSNVNRTRQKSKLVERSSCPTHYLYVLGNLLSQGEMELIFQDTNGIPKKRWSYHTPFGWAGVPDPSNRISFRLVTGVWSLAAFIFVQAYTSTLITYVGLVSPVNLSLVSSAYDLVDQKDINVLVRKSGAIDTMFSERISILIQQIWLSKFTVVTTLSFTKTEYGIFKVTGKDATESILFHNLRAHWHRNASSFFLPGQETFS